MRRFSEWFVNRKENLTFLAAIIFSIALIFSNESFQIQTVKVWTLDGFGFVLGRIAAVNRFASVYEQNQRLRLSNAKLMLENSKLNEALLENQRLRNLLEFKSESALNLVPAKVVGRGQNGFINSIILDAGKANDLTKNLPVVTAQGVVGKLFNVASHHSTAQLLLDRNFRVSATIQRSRVRGIIKWFEGNRVTLAEVPKRSDVKVGDMVVTSGFSALFPSGLEIGRVVKVTEAKQDMFMNILVQPAVDFSRLEEVFVVKTQPSQAS
ncbi:rod shape-determining protein MreC [candidate division KSB1 bacterium]|nr:rod shape-determining protein MreC [candidate division KSB1 bacterium]NIR72155.1 rod shape-determining protein MreC [candidate division KSB1 bacterium]NIS26620.1 rod shape-determining protein MreC [candidate division KSB1 bacterium]NIT73388.1 rod shape-determining protein MreC [candidate division KSB1 bacterium]NIU27236.1 rod shape-determining protein MreC [candidate division KSB1 bacterium]